MNFLVENNEAHLSQRKIFLDGGSISRREYFPALRIAAERGAADDASTIRPLTIGTVDGESAAWMAHPGAIYLHEAQQYFVEELNLEEHIAHLKPIESDYYTEPLRRHRGDVLLSEDHAQSCRHTAARKHGANCRSPPR